MNEHVRLKLVGVRKGARANFALKTKQKMFKQIYDFDRHMSKEKRNTYTRGFEQAGIVAQ
jgi:hypothetical protein